MAKGKPIESNTVENSNGRDSIDTKKTGIASQRNTTFNVEGRRERMAEDRKENISSNAIGQSDQGYYVGSAHCHQRDSYRTEIFRREIDSSVEGQLEADHKCQESLSLAAGVTKHSSSELEPFLAIKTWQADTRSDSHASEHSHHTNQSLHSHTGSSSHQDSDIFSEHSLRSSLGSPSFHSREADEGALTGKAAQTPPPTGSLKAHEKKFIQTQSRRKPKSVFSPRHEKGRIAMTSPEPDGCNGSSRTSLTCKPGSSLSAQDSPKSKDTPPHLKRRDIHLVLLHVTLIPLKCPWAGLVDRTESGNMSEECKNLRDSWRLLQDRIGDTMLERGILIPHPQDDYEALEERLLEALDLPTRRQTRRLDCGHYAAPPLHMAGAGGDEDSGDEFDHLYSDDFDKMRSRWCSICRCQTKLDSLRLDKVFRIKIYASNGLISAGAWAACWKEMERVDVELEPFIEAPLQDELEHLVLTRDDRKKAEMDTGQPHMRHSTAHLVQTDNELVKEHLINEPLAEHPSLLSSPVPPMSSPGLAPSPTPNTRRRLDEERLREVYGCTPPASAHEKNLHSRAPSPSPFPTPQNEAFSPPLSREDAAVGYDQSGHGPESQPRTAETISCRGDHHPESFIPMTSPPSPAAQAFARKELRQSLHNHHQQATQAPKTQQTMSEDASLARPRHRSRTCGSARQEKCGYHLPLCSCSPIRAQVPRFDEAVRAGNSDHHCSEKCSDCQDGQR